MQRNIRTSPPHILSPVVAMCFLRVDLNSDKHEWVEYQKKFLLSLNSTINQV